MITGISSPSANSLIIVPETGEDLSSSNASFLLILRLLEVDKATAPEAFLEKSGLLENDPGLDTDIGDEISLLHDLGDSPCTLRGLPMEDNIFLLRPTPLSPIVSDPKSPGLIAKGATSGGRLSFPENNIVMKVSTVKVRYSDIRFSGKSRFGGMIWCHYTF